MPDASQRPRERPRHRATERLLFVATGLMLTACVSARSTPAALTEPALTLQTSSLFQSGLSAACLPRHGDSTRFDVVLVVDSLDQPRSDQVTLVRAVRAAPRAGYVNQSVSIEIQRAGQTRRVGTSCWHDAGIVVRGSATVLGQASIIASAPATVVLRVLDGRGRALSDQMRSTQQGDSARVTWRRR